jgi:hypothetical protein
MSDDAPRPRAVPSEPATVPVPIASADAPRVVPQGRTCEECGAALGDGQMYCIECGAPTGLARPRRRPAYGRMIAAGLLAALLAGGLGYGVGVLQARLDQEPRALPAQAARSPSEAPVTAAPPSEPVEEPTAEETETDAGTRTQAPTGAPGGGVPGWPAGRTGWTVVLASVRSETDANTHAQRVQASGQPAGVLFSSNFSSLRPGYYVVYSGILNTREEAAAQVSNFAATHPGAYAVQIQG